MSNPISVNIIGTGNIAHYFARLFVSSKITIHTVYSRNIEHAEKFAKAFESTSVNSLTQLSTNASLTLMAISDSSIAEVAANYTSTVPLIHTSGSTPLQILTKYQASAGVFYPLQSLTHESVVSPSQVPILIESEDLNTISLLEQLAKTCGLNTSQVSSEKRQYLHLSAVFINNFGNHLAKIAEEITSQQSLPFDLLKPLILETAHKLQQATPSQNQTGPAKRHDITTIEKHLSLLEPNPTFVQLYKLLSEDILRTYFK